MTAGTPPWVDSSASEGALDFGALVGSLATSAWLHLGEGSAEEQTLAQINLPLAHQTIELLGLLRQKTRGNLSAEEQQLLDEVLYDLRLRYVRANKEAASTK